MKTMTEEIFRKAVKELCGDDDSIKECSIFYTHSKHGSDSIIFDHQKIDVSLDDETIKRTFEKLRKIENPVKCDCCGEPYIFNSWNALVSQENSYNFIVFEFRIG